MLISFIINVIWIYVVFCASAILILPSLSCYIWTLFTYAILRVVVVKEMTLGSYNFTSLFIQCRQIKDNVMNLKLVTLRLILRGLRSSVFFEMCSVACRHVGCLLINWLQSFVSTNLEYY